MLVEIVIMSKVQLTLGSGVVRAVHDGSDGETEGHAELGTGGSGWRLASANTDGSHDLIRIRLSEGYALFSRIWSSTRRPPNLDTVPSDTR